MSIDAFLGYFLSVVFPVREVDQPQFDCAVEKFLTAVLDWEEQSAKEATRRSSMLEELFQALDWEGTGVLGEGALAVFGRTKHQLEQHKTAWTKHRNKALRADMDL